ncbi:MAG: family 10 glycosylhydrolase [Candidatus Sericytochromatia bacterium]
MLGKNLIKTTLGMYLFINTFLLSASYAFEQKFFELEPIKYNESLNFIENINKLKINIDSLNDKIKQQEKLYYNTNYRQSKKIISESKKLLEYAEVAYTTDDNQRANLIIKNIVSNLNEAQLNLLPSRSAEMRGMLLDGDSIPKNKEEITKLILKLKNAGFNAIFPEVFRRGYTMVKSGLTETDPTFKDLGFDVLEYIIQEAHKNNIQVHPWFWCFRVKSPEKGNPLLSKYPYLAATKEDDKNFEPLFLSASAPESKDIVTNIIRFFAANYDVDGVLLDYIRYDDQAPEDFLSKKYFREYYLNKKGVEPPLDIPKNEPIFTEWQLWREKQINLTVEKIKKQLKSIKPNISIGAAVFRTEGEGRLTKMQDWRLWSSNSWINYICPMLYTNNKFDMKDWIDSETDLENRKEFLYPVLGIHKFKTPEDTYSQYGILFNREVAGLTFFTLAYFNNSLYEDLPKGIFRKIAIVPEKYPKKSLNILLTDISKWLKEVQKEESMDISEEEFKNFIYKVDILNKNLFEEKNDLLKYTEIKKDLLELRKISDLNKNTNVFPKNLSLSINEQLEYVLKITDIALRKEVAKNKVFEQSLPPFKPLKETKELPVAYVTPISNPPIIDGKIDTNIWSNIEPLGQFYWHLGFSKSEVETVVKLAYGIENMYVLFENLEPNIKKVTSKTSDDNDWNIYKDDNVEFLLNITGLNEDFRFTINMNNAKMAQKNGKAIEIENFETAVNVEDKKWFVEMKIPFEAINFKPQKGSTLRVNFSRTRYQELNPYSHWSPTYNTVDNIFRFGTMVFK